MSGTSVTLGSSCELSAGLLVFAFGILFRRDSHCLMASLSVSIDFEAGPSGVSAAAAFLSFLAKVAYYQLKLKTIKAYIIVCVHMFFNVLFRLYIFQ